jgi:DNA-binding Lrp family transcriptional regulator
MIEPETSFHSAFNEHYNLVSRKIIRALSDDARLPISDLAKQLQLSRNTVRGRLTKLEKELGIRYTIEFDEDKLGISNPHIIAVKFTKKPSNDYLRDIFSRSYIPQMVVSVKGSFDLLIFANAISRDEYAHWDKSMQIFLAEYGVSWQPSEVAHRHLGFYALRNELLDRLEIPPRYKTMLKILNQDGRASFQQISKQSGMHFNTVAYAFRKLLSFGYIKRFTLVMKKPKDVTVMTHVAKYIISELFEQDAKKTRSIFKSDEEYPVASRYMLVHQLIGSNDHFAMGVFDDAEVAYRNYVGNYTKMMKPERPRVVYGTVDEVLLGDLPIRSVDINKEYRTLVWSPNFEKQ